jgi:oligopeptidase B
MINRRTLLVSMGAIAFATLTTVRRGLAAVSRWPMPPQPRREPRIVGNFGHRRPDDYGWLRAKDWHAVLRDPTSLEPKIKEAVLAENAYTKAMMAPSEPLQSDFVARMIELEASKRTPIEIEDRGFLYYKRESAGGDHPSTRDALPRVAPNRSCWMKAMKPEARRTTSCIGMVRSVAPALNFSAGLADETGSGAFSIHVLDMRSGRTVISAIKNAHGDSHFLPTAAISSGQAATKRPACQCLSP